MKIVIVRHGQVPHNIKTIYTAKDESFTEEGIIQAKILGEELSKYLFDVAYCSPLIRCKETCNYIVKDKKKIIYDERLIERDESGLEGISIEGINTSNYWNYYCTDYDDKTENVQVFFKRVYSFIDSLKKENYENVLVVAHNGVSKAFRGYFCGINDGNFYKKGLKNGEFWEFEL